MRDTSAPNGCNPLAWARRGTSIAAWVGTQESGMKTNMEGWERVVSIAAGAALFEVARRGRGLTRTIACAAGTGLLARGASGYCPVHAALGHERRRDDPRRALAGARGILIAEGVTMQVSARTLYDFWRDPSNLPRAMPYLVSVRSIDETRSHWIARGPAGHSVEWDAVIINDVPGELIGWQSLPGADVASAGSVRFRPLTRGGTQVDVRLQYAPPGGRLGASVAWLLGSSPAAQVREALRQLKQVLETGEVPTVEGQTSGGRSAAFAAVKSIA
jgi:uncharacterized membrane protein